MTANRVILSALMLALVTAPAMAQGDKAPSPAAPPAPAASPNQPATTGKATAPAAAKTNLNTASAAELQKLPKMTQAHAKAIVDARTKAKFKNWDDFVARKVIPGDAASGLKEVVAF